jgi:carbon storage regulator
MRGDSTAGGAMLVLTRRIGEEICIAESIRVRIIRIDKNHVYLGIIAPPEVRVDRMEVHLRRLQNGADVRNLTAVATSD